MRSSGALALATLASRVLGFFREVLTAMILGGGTLAAAWNLAFILPNMFRRILGEGALGTALVPLISHTIEKEGHEKAREKFSAILFWLTLLLALISVLISLASLIAVPYAKQEHLKLALKAAPLVMPYSIFICTIGVISSLLNSMRVFFIPALASLLLNILMVGCLYFVCPFLTRDMDILNSLSISVLISGILEIILMLWLLKKYEMFPSFRKSNISHFDYIKEIWYLTLPGLFGASVLQISLIADKAIACWISEYAVPALVYSDRLIYLPVGVFAVSFGTVSLTEMSRASARGEIDLMIKHMAFAMKQLLFIAIPVTAFMMVFGHSILELVYMRGAFGEKELTETYNAFKYFVFGIPAFAAAKVSVAAFYARKDMKTTVKISAACITLNIIMNLLLMRSMAQSGIALSTVICSYINNISLLLILKLQLGNIQMKSILLSILKTLFSSVAAAVAALYIYNVCKSAELPVFISKELLPLLAASAAFGLVFPAAAFLSRSEEFRDLLGHFIKRRTR